MKPALSQARVIPTGIFASFTYQRVYNALFEASLIQQPPSTLRRLQDRYAIVNLIPSSQYLSTLLRRSKLAGRIYYGSRPLAYRNYIHGPLLREACFLLALEPPALPVKAFTTIKPF